MNEWCLMITTATKMIWLLQIWGWKWGRTETLRLGHNVLFLWKESKASFTWQGHRQPHTKLHIYIATKLRGRSRANLYTTVCNSLKYSIKIAFLYSLSICYFCIYLFIYLFLKFSLILVKTECRCDTKFVTCLDHDAELCLTAIKC